MGAPETIVSIETDLGTVALAWHGGNLRSVLLGTFQAGSRTGRKTVHGEAPDTGGRRLVDAMLAYFDGREPRFQADLELSAYTEFQRSVWGATAGIPHGETRSYSWVASHIGRPKAARAVGAALGSNPAPIVIPCHRVVGANGSLTGYAFGLGWKEALLDLERSRGVRVDGSS